MSKDRKTSIHCRNMDPDLVEKLELGKILSRSKNMAGFLRLCLKAWEREQEAIKEAHTKAISHE